MLPFMDSTERVTRATAFSLRASRVSKKVRQSATSTTSAALALMRAQKAQSQRRREKYHREAERIAASALEEFWHLRTEWRQVQMEKGIKKPKYRQPDPSELIKQIQARIASPDKVTAKGRRTLTSEASEKLMDLAKAVEEKGLKTLAEGLIRLRNYFDSATYRLCAKIEVTKKDFKADLSHLVRVLKPVELLAKY